MHPGFRSEAAESVSARRPPTVGVGAYLALAVLFGMNLLNYVDRYVFASVGPAITDELHLSDRRFGILASAFMVVYTIVSPFVGWMGDRYHRRRLLSGGVALWSLATAGTAFADSFAQMFFWRALLGVGEASYGVVAPTLLADLFPVALRGRVMGIFYLALPIGSALGYGLGGWIHNHLGWRTAFLVVGLPGLLLSLAGLLIPDPGRGASEGYVTVRRARAREYLALFRARSFLYNIAGMSAVTFATGALAVWGPTFYSRVRYMRLDHANYWLGVLTALAGLLGIGLGMWGADSMRRATRRAYLLWPALAVALAVPLGALAILDPDQRVSLSVLFCAMVLMASVLGPSSTVAVNVVAPNLRAAGFALNIFLVHLFGDISSPMLIGELSDLLGRPEIVRSPLGEFLETLGALPHHRRNLTAGMLAVVPVMLLGSVFFLLGSRHLAQDEERARLAR